MKMKCTKKTKNSGSALLVSLFVCLVLSISLGSYLMLVQAQARKVTWSQSWNNALAVAETGAEEALAHLNPGTFVAVNPAANGWGLPSGGMYGPITRNMGQDQYSVVFTAQGRPVIYSTGQVSVVALSRTLTRVIRVTTTNLPLYTVAMVALENIDLNGGGILTDSFDSSNPNLSTNGFYDPSRTSTNGDIASLGGLVEVGSASVHGDIYLGPGATDEVSKNGTVSGTTYYDFNADFPPAELPGPVTSFIHVPAMIFPTNINGASYSYYFGASGDYSISGGSGNVYVAPGAKVRLYVTSSFSPSVIRVAGTGLTAGNLQLYMGGTDFRLSGQSIVDGGNAANLGYWGLSQNTSISFSGNSSFVGTIYAPNAAFTLGGGGSSVYDFVGACVVKSVTMNGHFQFHYDESLLRAGPVKGYSAASWREIGGVKKIEDWSHGAL